MSASSIVGVPALEEVAPQTLAEAEAVLRECASRGASVAFMGGGTELGQGYPPECVATLLRTERLDRIVEYEPADMIVTTEAGITLRALQRALAPQRQRLASDAPLADRATVGGLLATNAFGPRRARYGTLRDLIVGVSLVRADGTRARGGGKVVKNVAGFDLPKLMVGSLGTLGLIATATFRLHPLPEVACWVRVAAGEPKTVRSLSNLIVTRQLEPAALLAHRGPKGYDLYALFEGFAAGVEEQLARFVASAQTQTSPAEVLDDAAAARVVALDEAAQRTGRLRIRASLPPSAFETLAHDVVERLESCFAHSAAVAYPSLAVAFVGGEPADGETLAAALVEARRACESAGGNLVLTEVADAVVRERVDVFGTLPPSFALMRRLKERFDPEGRLNPGRFLGRL